MNFHFIEVPHLNSIVKLHGKYVLSVFSFFCWTNGKFEAFLDWDLKKKLCLWLVNCFVERFWGLLHNLCYFREGNLLSIPSWSYKIKCLTISSIITSYLLSCDIPTFLTWYWSPCLLKLVQFYWTYFYWTVYIAVHGDLS